MSELLLNLKPCPAPDDGVHRWVYYAACRAVDAGIPDEQAIEMIEAMMTRNPNPASEVRDALKSARGEPSSPSVLWPQVNEEQVEAIAQDGMRVLDLWETSPFPMRTTENRTDEVIDILFPGNQWLCVGQSKQSFATRRREEWRGKLHTYSLLVPSPMKSQTGLTKSGRESFHSLDNTGPRRFLIIEADRGDLDQQAAVIGHLAESVPLAAVVFSGKKSLHGWFFCEGTSEEKVLKFMRYAVSLGADEQMWLRSQFCRMPDGRRFDAKNSEALSQCGLIGIPAGRQALIYLNPKAIL